VIDIWLKNIRPGRRDPSHCFLQRCDSMRVRGWGSAKDVIIRTERDGSESGWEKLRGEKELGAR
jgi:hypothetical protein